MVRELRLELLQLLRAHPRFPTWWVREHLDGVAVADARAELKRMEAAGLVTRCPRSERNNIIWMISAAGGTHA